MTALNIWHDGRHAYLLNDTAITGADGRVLSFTAKTVTIAGLPMAIGVTGLPILNPLMFELELLSPSHPADVVCQLPKIVRELSCGVARHLPVDFSGQTSIGLAVAVWDPDEKRPMLFVIGSDHGFLPDALDPYSVIPLHFWLTGNGAYGPFDPDRNFTGLGQFSPDRDGLQMLIEQRSQPFDDGHYRIGGEAILTTVGSEGVSSRTLETWPDRIGDVIDPGHRGQA